MTTPPTMSNSLVLSPRPSSSWADRAPIEAAVQQARERPVARAVLGTAPLRTATTGLIAKPIRSPEAPFSSRNTTPKLVATSAAKPAQATPIAVGQVFPFDAKTHWPTEIAGRKMDTYHRWMETCSLVSMSELPSLNVPVGFNARGLPMGMQIDGRNQAELSCLQLAFAYDEATRWVEKRRPALLGA